MKTSVNNTVWEVKFYPYKDFYPTTNNINQSLKEGDPFVLKKGITSVSLSRSKNTPYGTASVTVVGTPEKPFQKGSWVIVYSRYGELEEFGDGAKLPRFAGQLVSYSVNYTTDSTGNVRQTTNLVIREWSAVFKSPIRLDARAADQSLVNQALAIAVNDGSLDKAFFKDTDLQNFAKSIINSFDFVRVVLYFVGAYSRKDELFQDNKELAGLPSFSPIALNAPAVPSSFLKDLGLKVKDNRVPYETDMVDYWIGVTKEKINLPKFKGVFTQDKLESYKKTYTTEANRPYIKGILAAFAKGFSAFDIINEFGDMNLNELYTDIVYVQGNDKKIKAVPTIVYRSKPTILKYDEENYERATGESFSYLWSYYDDLPTIDIDSVYIRSLSLIDTSEGSPNYIRPDIIDSRLYNSQSLSNLSIKKLPSQMYRYGGVSAFVPVQFNQPVGLNKSEKTQEDKESTESKKKISTVRQWFSDVKNFIALSESYNYMKPNMRMTLKDNNLPLSVGMNLSFTLTDIKYVAHIESISIEHGIDARGVIYTNTVLECSRLVFFNSGTSKLEPLREEMFADMFVRSNIVFPLGGRL